MSELKAGYYSARITDYGLNKSAKKGTLFCWIEMFFTDKESEAHTMTWRGYLSQGAKQYTVETIVKLGFTGSDFAKITEGIDSGVLKTDIDYKVKVEYETYEAPVKDENGNPKTDNMGQELTETKRIAKLKSIYTEEESFGNGRLSREDAVVTMQGLNLGADLIEARQKFAKDDKKVENKEVKGIDSTDIPF